MREWMKTIPDTLKEYQELIDKAMQDYELIEEFFYNLTADDFNAKWVKQHYNSILLLFEYWQMSLIIDVKLYLWLYNTVICFNFRWNTVGWPHKIEQQMELTEKQLEEDEERFHKLQMSDQANFNDKLDTLSVRTDRYQTPSYFQKFITYFQ